MFSRLSRTERGVYLENKKRQDAKGPPVSYAVMTQELVKIQEHCCGLYEKTNNRITNQGNNHDLEWNNLFSRIKTLEKAFQELHTKIQEHIASQNEAGGNDEGINEQYVYSW